MSSFSGTMEISHSAEGGQSNYRIRRFSYSTDRNSDFEGRPASRPRNSIIEVEVDAPAEDVMLFSWLCMNQAKNGTIRFNQINQESTFATLRFEQGFCLSYKHSFSASDSAAMTVTVTITTGRISITSGSSECTNDFFIGDSAFHNS